MQLRIVLLLIFLLLSFDTKADNFYTIGSRSSSMANASVALHDVWSGFHNQAGLAFLEKKSFGAFYESRFLVPELSLRGAIGALPTKHGTYGLSVTSFGYELFSRNRYAFAYARKFGDRFAMGAQFNYLRTVFADNYGSKNLICGEVGIQAKLTNDLTLGVHAFNPTRVQLADYDNEKIPTILRLGFNYSFSEELNVNLETLKDINHPASFRLGMEYKPIDALYLRAGMGSNPFLFAFGVGMAFKEFKMDICSTYHSVLGHSPQLSLNYSW